MDNVIDVMPKHSIIPQIELHYWKTDAVMKKKKKNFIADSIIFNITPQNFD
jgi:hypothetical protein